MSKKIYIICPVRNASAEVLDLINTYANRNENEGNKVFFPPRDAPQDSLTGYEIIDTELKAIKDCDEVHVFWDVKSSGSHFDLGMAYALNKPIIFICQLYQVDPPNKKSYYKAILEYNQKRMEEDLKCRN